MGTPYQPHGVAFHPDGTAAFVTGYAHGALMMIDAVGDTALAQSLPFGAGSITYGVSAAR